MTHEETQKRLDAIAAAMTEAGILEPEAMLSQRSGGRHHVYFSAAYNTKPFDGKEYKHFFGENIDELLTQAADYVASLPDADTIAKKEWQRDLGKVIDKGHALNLPDEVMTPLRQGSQAMTENLLAAPEDKS